MSSQSPSVEQQSSFTAHQKAKAVLRVLSGEKPEGVALELGVSTERLLRWQRRFIDGGRANLLQRRSESSKSRDRRKLWLQWSALILGLVFVMWLVTRFLSASGSAGSTS